MAIEVKVSGTPQEVERDYPYLAKHESGALVLFTRKTTGMCLHPDVNNRVGAMSGDWVERDFTPLSPSETITLSNKA